VGQKDNLHHEGHEEKPEEYL